MKTALIMTMMMVSGLSQASNSDSQREVASVKPMDVRVTHARELLGSGYRKSLVNRIQSLKNVRSKVLATVKKRLPKKFKTSASYITSTIIQEAKKHGLDPYFVMALIAGESSFNPEAVGPVGEIGMMQIRPATGKWMAKKARIPWNGLRTLQNPVTNIRIGTAYIAYLRQKFAGQGQLYVAAYNMGARSVKRALNKNIKPKDYPIHVMKRYIAFYQEN